MTSTLTRLLCAFPALLFFFNDTATTDIYTLSLHDALPISQQLLGQKLASVAILIAAFFIGIDLVGIDQVDADEEGGDRSEEHTSELQSQSNLVCRLLLEKKKKKNNKFINTHDSKTQ